MDPATCGFGPVLLRSKQGAQAGLARHRGGIAVAGAASAAALAVSEHDDPDACLWHRQVAAVVSLSRSARR